MNRMLKIWVPLFILMVFLSCYAIYNTYAQEWVTVNQATITWDAVTKLSNNTTIPETNRVKYEVYLSNVITDSDKSSPVKVGATNATSYTITMTTQGKFFVGLRTMLEDANGTFLNKSVIGWTDDPAIVRDGHTFGLRYYFPPLPPTGVWAEWEVR